MFQDKGHDKINNDGAAEGKERQVYKIHAHCGGFNAEALSQPLAYAKSPVLEPLRDPVYHKYKDIQN
jgi:hypothetical protein